MLISLRFSFLISFSFIAFSILGNNDSTQNLKEYQQSIIEEKTFDKEEWESIIEDLDYTPEPLKEKEERTNFELSPFWTAVIKYSAIILVIAVLSFLVYKVLMEDASAENSEVSRRKQTAFGLGKAAEDIHQADLESLLKNALALEDFKLAVRVYYLIAIKQLSSASLIHWKKDKTNAEYLAELTENQHYSTFQQLTITFERTWYGNLQISKQEYQNVAPVFQHFIENFKEKTAS